MNRDEMSVGTERMESGRAGDQLGEKRETITVDLTNTKTHKHTTVAHFSPALMNCCWLIYKSRSCSVPQTLSRTETHCSKP